ncbi:hypothetical protein [Paenibacillus sp. B2(2019)]|nr:hypothetical protein [Paenibacillus sp. B2(2019)]
MIFPSELYRGTRLRNDLFGEFKDTPFGVQVRKISKLEYEAPTAAF